jgi:biopolymer transport protein TolR
MKMSRRAQRMDRHHKRKRLLGELNMVSLMDIFTILVFFLLVNSSDVETLPSTKSVRLPDSVAEKAPRQTVVVVVNEQDIVVQGRKVASVAAALTGDDIVMPALKAALAEQEARILRADASATPAQREITIMGNKEIPYALLKRVMATCADAGFGQVSLAVLQRSAGKV